MNSDNIQGLTQILQLFEFQKILVLLLGILVLAVSVRAIHRLADRIGSRLPSRRLVILQFVTIAGFSVYIFGGTLLVYGALQPSKELMIAIGGSAAVAIGLSLKDLVSSLVAGVILLFDRPFQVGDRVTFGGIYGEIKTVGLRAVRLETLDDNLVTIPNSRFITDAVSSGNFGALDMMVVMDFHIALDADLSSAMNIVREVLLTSRYAYLRKAVSILATEVAVAEMLAIQVRAKAYVLDVKYEKAFTTDVTVRVQDAFRKASIARPIR